MYAIPLGMRLETPAALRGIRASQAVMQREMYEMRPRISAGTLAIRRRTLAGTLVKTSGTHEAIFATQLVVLAIRSTRCATMPVKRYETPRVR
jgi:hypothetical protein